MILGEKYPRRWDKKISTKLGKISVYSVNEVYYDKRREKIWFI
jgi:hypothetical protein